MSVFIGRGKVRVRPVNPTNGKALGAWFDLGEVSNFEPNAAVETLEKFSKRDTSQALIAFVDVGTTTGINLTLDEPNTKNLELIVRGESVAVASGTVTDEVLVSDDPNAVELVEGDIVRTKYPINAITSIEDSDTPTPNVLNSANYDIIEGSSFYILLGDLTGMTQPLVITYTRRGSTIIAAYEGGAKNYQVAIENVNLVAPDEAQLVEYYNVRFPPSENFGLITDDFAPYVLNGRALAVSAFESDPHLGKYGRVIRDYLPPA